MPLGQVDAELFMEHDGVKVYCTYTDDDVDKPSDYVYTTKEDWSAFNPFEDVDDSGKPTVFDVLDLPNPENLDINLYASQKRVIRDAIDAGIVSRGV